jgi:signal transduction histidine kinase/CheY-like chemotaxis protein
MIACQSLETRAVPKLDKPKILVVNDDANSLFALTSLLGQWAEQEVLHAKISVFVALAMKNEELKTQARQLSQRTTELTSTNRRLVREMAERQVVERQNHAKDEFLAMLGHELRNPLSAISSAASLIGLPGVSADGVARARKIIQRQSQHLGRIVDDLLDLSRAMSGKIRLARAPLDVASLVAASLETYRATGRSTDYELVQDLDPGWVDGDATRLEQITSNLLDNALKYTPPGGRIEVRTWTENDEVVLSVRDSGVGIAPDLLPHVFDIFVQGSSTLDRAQGGLGIGLSLVRRLAELHDGSIGAESKGPGGGSTFTLRLPRIEHVQEEAPAAAPASEDAKPTVLLIEDNDDGREMMAMMLACYGYPVQHAADGLQGLELAASSQPDLALVDIGLPGLDGFEVARRLRADPATRDIKLIALTGYGSAEDLQRVLEAGFDLHLVKPVDIDHLMQVIGDCARATFPAARV